TRDDVLHGQEGNDFLYGEDGDDILYGGNGNDQLIDYEGNNSLFGGDGDDVLDVTGSAGHNYLEGEGGSDQIYGGIGNSSIYGGDGNDLLDASLSLGNNTLSGENGDDTIYGGSGNDVLYSGAGDDTLYGGAGNDELYSGNGNDVLYGGDGDDALIVGNTCGNTILDGGDGDDDFYAISTVGYIEFYGGNGNDVINAGIGDQRLYGGSGDDIMFAGSGNQYLYGDSGNDNMFASDGVQLLDGGDDDDEIHADGTTGNSTFIGGAGNDYIMGGAGTQTIDGGTGNDELWAGYGLQNIIGGEGNDTIHSYDNYNKHTIDGGDGDDLIYVSNGYINGGNGFDTIHLYSSGTVNGGSGNDTITLYSAGMVDGGDGDDIIISSGGFGGKVDGGNGNDSITAYAATDQSLAICGGSDDDVIELYGDGFSVEGGDGNDVIRECWASHDSNILEGGAGDDIIFTFSGSSMDGGTGNDTLNGSIGEDAYIFNLGYGADTIIDYDETAGNIDSIWFGEGILPSDIKITRVNNDMCITIIGQTDTLTIKNYYDYWDFDLDYAIEQFQFEDGTVWDQTYINAQTIYIYGSDTADEIYGVWENNHIVYAGADDDEIFLGDGLNIVYGEAGDDIICTYAGNDQLYGGDGDDYLDANCGDDYLDGGTGNDTYIFEHGYGTDTIIDQDNSSDNIDTIEFGYDIIPEDIIISRAGQNMEITIAGQTDKLIIQSYYESDSYKVERFVFRDGTIWDSNAISQQPVHIAGTEASETITGDYDAPYNEILDGKGGNDTLKGYMGNDTYIFGIGYGVDTIKDEDITAGNIDTIRFGDGIDPSDITINRVGSNMEITVAGQTDKLIIQSFFSYEDNSFKIERFEFSDSTVWDAETIRMQPIYRTGTAGSERISGNDSNVYNEIFDGKGGDDILKGSTGNDTYIFNLGYGTNTIYDIDATTGNIDTIRFGEGISAADIRINQVGSDMEITINGQSDKLIIDDYFYNDSYKVERFEFSDGTVWDANTIKQQSVYVTGTGSGETLVGNDDTPYNEILDGKGGNDTLKGYMGNDTYIFGIGYGVDTIKDEDITAGNIDTIRFGEGIDASDITINRVGSNMEITVAGQTDKLIIQSFFSYGDNSFKIERFEFSDSTVWDAEAIRMQPIYRTGTAGSETISGNDSNVYNEIFDGKGGDDVLKGSTGNDTYIFGVGYGSDRIYDIDSTLGNTDKIEYADSALSLIFSRTYDDLVISNAETNDILTVKAWYSGSLNQVEEIHDNTGLVILNTQIEQLIQEMAAFEQQNNISWSDAVEQCPNDVQSILSQFWVAS
ncbi:MAG: calcium-binding protein, partial [Oscillospiraceae bacterium]|nr:calcium-binding protein [Oscillospiraceae bacterium]